MASGTTTLMATFTVPRTPASAWALPAIRPSVLERLRKTVARVLGDAFEAHPILCVTTALLFAGAALVFPLLFLDPRQVGGMPVWAGPFRFFLSMATYCGTILAFGMMMGPTRVFHRVGALISGVAVLELTLMVAQAAFGSGHAPAWDDAVGITLGIAFTALWISSVFVAVAMFRRPMGAPGLACAARLSMVIALAGMAVGLPGLAVGVADGGRGLGLVEWSLGGGNLRPAHFMGLHAIQLLPAFAWLLGRRKSLPDAYQVTLVGVASAGYACLMGVLAWQAARAQPPGAPDALTLAALIVVLAGVASAGAAVLSHAASQGAGAPAAPAEPWQPAATSPSSLSVALPIPLIPRPRLADASVAGTDVFDPLPAMRSSGSTTAEDRPRHRGPVAEPPPLKGTVTLRPARASGRVARIRSAKQPVATAREQATELDHRAAAVTTIQSLRAG
jgi:hypothetical protein